MYSAKDEYIGVGNASWLRVFQRSRNTNMRRSTKEDSKESSFMYSAKDEYIGVGNASWLRVFQRSENTNSLNKKS